MIERPEKKQSKGDVLKCPYCKSTKKALLEITRDLMSFQCLVCKKYYTIKAKEK